MCMSPEEFRLSVAAMVISAVVAYATARRSAYDRVTALIADLTTGEVAQARHVMGTMAQTKNGDLDSRLAVALPDTKEDDRLNEARRHLFLVLWAIDRVHAQALSFCFPASGPEKLMIRTLGYWIEWWAGERGLAAVVGDLPGTGAAAELERHQELAKRWRDLGGPGEPSLCNAWRIHVAWLRKVRSKLERRLARLIN